MCVCNIVALEPIDHLHGTINALWYCLLLLQDILSADFILALC